MSVSPKPEIDPKGNSGDANIESATKHHLSAKGAALFEKLLTYDDLVPLLQMPKRSIERLVSRGVIRKVAGMYQVRFYWPDVLEDLRNRKGVRQK